ncbi:MAG: spore coat associated protein CotJA [Firmicutes bacterium]|nr:spore coat associated protein CotJA [Bacillota bacterium]
MYMRRVAGEVEVVPPECVPKLLPRRISLGEAYVPYQVYGPTYGPAEALCAGTIFPELYRPYAKSVCMEGGWPWAFR